MSRILHIVPGTSDVANGMVIVARLLAKEQGDAEVVDLNHEIHKIHESDVEEVWVHGMWLPKEWAACRMVLRAGKRLVRMTHGSLSPVYLTRQSPLKKKLVSPIERYFLRRADKVVATCEAEAGWIRSYLGHRCPPIEVTDIKRFFKLNNPNLVNPVNPVKKPLHLLYLGRRHPLKGVEYLEAAVRQIQAPSAPLGTRVARRVRFPIGREPPQGAATRLCVRIISNAFGDELEKVWDWCDILVLPTLSENFGLVIAEALERGKRVITTDGAPVWGDNLSRAPGSCWSHELELESGSLNSPVEHEDDGEILFGYDGRLIYLKGYRDGSDEKRVELLKSAIEMLCCAEHKG